MTVRRCVRIALSPLARSCTPLAAQVTLAGQALDARACVGGQHLQVNGVGLRAAAWFHDRAVRRAGVGDRRQSAANTTPVHRS
jgi:hypothetical protein